MNRHQAIEVAIRALSYDERTEEAERKSAIKVLEDLRETMDSDPEAESVK